MLITYLVRFVFVDFNMIYMMKFEKKKKNYTEASLVLYVSRVLLKYTYLDPLNIALF